MEGAVLMTPSHFICCLSWGVSRAIILRVAQTLLREVARSGAAQRPSCVLLDRLRLQGSGLGPVLPPCSWTSVRRSAKAFKWTRLFRRDAQVLFSCFLPFASYILLKVNFRSGYKLRHKGSTCNFLSASFFYLKNSSCNAVLVLSHLNSSLNILLGHTSWIVLTAYLFFKYLL